MDTIFSPTHAANVLKDSLAAGKSVFIAILGLSGSG